MTAATEKYVPDQGIMETFFTGTSRLNRLRFLKRYIVIAFISSIILQVYGGIFPDSVTIDMDTFAISFSLGYMLLSIILLIPDFLILKRRMADLNRGASLAISYITLEALSTIMFYFGEGLCAMLLSVVGLFIILYALFARGTVGPNDFGPDPLGE